MKTLLFTLVLLLGAACAQTDQQALQTYAEIAHASYQDALTLAQDLEAAVAAFLAAPSEAALAAARDAWLAAQEPYGQTEVFRFYGGPIDDADGPESLLNAWPLDEAYVDYVEGAPEAGIINNVTDYPVVDKALLISLNEVGAEENISSGYHAVEFLLWGQDLSPDTAGQRPYTDYTSAPNAERRGAYLAAATELIVEHLTGIVEAWAPDTPGNYRETFLALTPEAALQNILTGMGVLAKSELAGERIFTAYDNQDQEDEHSCFSDNTHRDIATNFQGIQNVYVGRYTRVDGSVVTGTGLSAVVAAADPALDERMLELLARAEAEVAAVPAPFDQAIVNPDTRSQIFDLVSSLLDLGDAVAEVGSALGVSINTALPN